MTDALLPAPLTTADCDLRGLPFMPLEVQRLRDSDLALISTGDEFKAAVLLWCAAWCQVPAGSLPDDDRILAKLAGTDLKTWTTVKAVALRGWVLCADGRLYHPLVSEKAMEALPGRRAYASRANAASDRKRREREDRATLFAQAKLLGLNPSYDIKTTDLRALVTRDQGASGRDVSQQVTRDASRNESVTSHSEKRDMSQPVTRPVTAKREKEKEKESPQPPLGAVCDRFEQALTILPDAAVVSADLDEARRCWTQLVSSGAATADELLAAVRMLAKAHADADAKGRPLAVKAFHRWLAAGTWRNLPAAASAGRGAAIAAWAGPPEIRSAILAHLVRTEGGILEAEHWAANWIDACTTWSDVPPAIVCLSRQAEKRIRSKIGPVLETLSVSLIVKSAGEAA